MSHPTASELLEATLARIDALNPALNAIVAQDREAARAMAAESDRRIAAGQARALEGLPKIISGQFTGAYVGLAIVMALLSLQRKPVVPPASLSE